MKGFVGNIEKLAEENNNFREVIYTAKNSQLVLMSLKPMEDIGEEVHTLDQFFRIEKGRGKVVIDGAEHEVSEGSAIVIPAGARHNVINTSSDKAMKVYTLYSPPNHIDGIVHATKEDAEVDTEHYDGKTTE